MINLLGGPLTSRDLTSLATRWITPELAAEQSIRRVSSLDGAAAMGRNGAGNYTGMVIPNVLPGTDHVREYRLRREHPEIEQLADGSQRETNRYLSPPGRGNMVYFPVGITPEMLADVTLPVIVTEGEFKTIALWRLSLWQADRPRFLPVGLSGVWNWRGVIGKALDADGARVDVKGVIPDLGRIVCKKRRTLILFDSDLEDNGSVQAARANLGKELRSRAAKVAFFDWPKPPAAKGIDDWLALAGPEVVLPFIEAALRSATKDDFRHSGTRKTKPQPEPPKGIAAEELITMDIFKPGTIMGGRLPSSGACLMVGLQKSNKTLVSLQVAFSIATDHPLFDTFNVGAAGPVLFIEKDDPDGESSVQDVLRLSPVIKKARAEGFRSIPANPKTKPC